jgi:hypothetical protein
MTEHHKNQEVQLPKRDNMLFFKLRSPCFKHRMQRNLLLVAARFSILAVTVYAKRSNEFVARIEVCCDSADVTYFNSKIFQQLVFQGKLASQQVSQLGMD